MIIYGASRNAYTTDNPSSLNICSKCSCPLFASFSPEKTPSSITTKPQKCLNRTSKNWFPRCHHLEQPPKICWNLLSGRKSTLTVNRQQKWYLNWACFCLRDFNQKSRQDIKGSLTNYNSKFHIWYKMEFRWSKSTFFLSIKIQNILW